MHTFCIKVPSELSLVFSAKCWPLTHCHPSPRGEDIWLWRVFLVPRQKRRPLRRPGQGVRLGGGRADFALVGRLQLLLDGVRPDRRWQELHDDGDEKGARIDSPNCAEHLRTYRDGVGDRRSKQWGRGVLYGNLLRESTRSAGETIGQGVKGQGASGTGAICWGTLLNLRDGVFK